MSTELLRRQLARTAQPFNSVPEDITDAEQEDEKAEDLSNDILKRSTTKLGNNQQLKKKEKIPVKGATDVEASVALYKQRTDGKKNVSFNLKKMQLQSMEKAYGKEIESTAKVVAKEFQRRRGHGSTSSKREKRRRAKKA